MKKLISFIFILSCVILVGCNNDENPNDGLTDDASGEPSIMGSGIVDYMADFKILEQHGQIHNDGLDFIIATKKDSPDLYTEARLDSIVREYTIVTYGNENLDSIEIEFNPLKKKMLSGDIPSMAKVKNNEFVEFFSKNSLAFHALDECLTAINERLESDPNEELFDNPKLLSDVQEIICDTYISYIPLFAKSTDKPAVLETLGVLHGSVEYWMDSKNVEKWSDCELKNKNDKNEEKKKLNPAEYLEAIAAADAIGALASPLAALFASTVVALYFDVE